MASKKTPGVCMTHDVCLDFSCGMVSEMACDKNLWGFSKIVVAAPNDHGLDTAK